MSDELIMPREPAGLARRPARSSAAASARLRCAAPRGAAAPAADAALRRLRFGRRRGARRRGGGSAGYRRLPEWLKVKLPGAGEYAETKALLRSQSLHTVCEEARCPNLGHCWERGTATIMILGELCTRRCGFCAVAPGKPNGYVDWDEPRRVGEAVAAMGLRHTVITSVARDDLEDGGSHDLRRVIDRDPQALGHRDRGADPRLPRPRRRSQARDRRRART